MVLEASLRLRLILSLFCFKGISQWNLIPIFYQIIGIFSFCFIYNRPGCITDLFDKSKNFNLPVTTRTILTGRDTFTPSTHRLDHTNDPDNSERNELLQTDLIRRKAQLYDMENNIPKQSGLYLKIILGNINVSILNKEEKWV